MDTFIAMVKETGMSKLWVERLDFHDTRTPFSG